MTRIILLFLLVLCLFPLQAFAQAAPTGGTSTFALFIPLIGGALGLLAIWCRSASASTGFLHTWCGHAFLMLSAAVAAGLAGVFNSGHVDKQACLAAAVGAISAWLGAWKTEASDKGGLQQKVAAVLLPLLFLGLTLPGCGYCNVQAHKAEPRCQAQAVVIDCGAPEVIKLVESVVIPIVLGALDTGDWDSAYTNLGNAVAGQGITSIVDLIRCALGKIQVTNPGALERRKLWLQQHPAPKRSTCRPEYVS